MNIAQDHMKIMLELDIEMSKIKAISEMSEEKSQEILNEAKDIAIASGYSVSGVLNSISSTVNKYGYSTDYVINKIKNNEPIYPPMQRFESAFEELYKNLKWNQKLLLWFYDKWDYLKDLILNKLFSSR